MLNIDPRDLQFFFGTARQPCPYIKGKFEAKAVTELVGPGALRLHDMLSQAGFRRSHGIAYRPACENCRACVPVRVVVDGFRPSRSMRKVLTRNADLTAVERPPIATAEQFHVFQAYEQTRHSDGDMALMDFSDYRSMVEDTPVETRIVEFRGNDNELVAVSLTDRLGDGLSGVYKFFAADRARTSPGTYVILWHIERARALGLPYVYLGYWIGESPKMAYKARFQPLEALIGEEWTLFRPNASDK
ncbi:MAG: arginyltransferase [Alphaproteobacteria bacterium]